MAALSPDDLMFIAEEEQILAEVAVALKAARYKRSLNYHRIGERLKTLREEATKAKTADLPALFDQMNTQRALIEHTPSDELPDERAPFFAHMKLEENGRTKHILLGHYTFLDGPVPIIDWRHAPVSRIYFNYKEDEEYEEELPGRIAEGRIIARTIVTIVNGTLVQVTRGTRSFERAPDDSWQVSTAGPMPALSGGAGSAQRGLTLGTGQSGRIVPEIAALLDADQFALLESPENEPLLILGGAGCGKTTVALHRTATLAYRNPQKYEQGQMVVIVPEHGLVLLSQKMLAGLGLNDVHVATFDHWVAMQARFLLRNLPRRICDATPAAVIRLKRHAAVRSAFPVFIQLRAEDLATAMEDRLKQSAAEQTIIREHTHRPLLERLDMAADSYMSHFESDRAHWNPSLRKAASDFFTEQRKKIWDLNADRMDFFGNPGLMEHIVAAAQGDIQRSTLETTQRHAFNQNGALAPSYSGIDPERLQTVTGHNLAEEPPDSKAGTMDVEDFAVLIELALMKTGRTHSPFGRLKTFSHMVIDEAQELAPIELQVLGRCLKPDASLTIAGDAAQQSDPAASFESWETLLGFLGVKVVHANHLMTSYRSTRQIAQFAHRILGSLAPATEPLTIKDGVPVARTLFPNDGHVVIFLRDALTELMAREPMASVAIVCRSHKSSLSFYEALADLPKVRFVPEGEFEFSPGIDVTLAQAVKGLEFDYVVIPDASSYHYPDTPIDRRLLHVATTRAIHQLWVIAIGRESPILRGIAADET